MIYSTQLFLGVAINRELEESLNEMNPLLKALMVQNNDSYLSEIEWQDQKFLGKFAGKISSVQNLDLLKGNVLSLFKRFLTSFPISDEALLLIAIPESE